MKSIRIFAFIVLGAIPFGSYTQTPKVSWEKQSQISGIDYFTDVIEDATVGYTVVGSKKSNDSSLDYWLVRFNNNGDTIWTKSLGTAYNDIPTKLTQLSDNSYILLGTTQMPDANKPFLVRVDKNGTERWRKIYEPTEILRAEDIRSTSNNGFVIAGAKGTDDSHMNLWMAEMDTSGTISWEKTFTESRNGCARAIKQLPDNGYILAGQVSESGKNNCDIITIRTDEKGKTKWESQIKTPQQKTWPKCICCSPDSSFFIVGWTGKCFGDINSDNPVFDFDMVLYKIDSKGKILWSKSFDREGSEGGDAVTICPNGNILVSGVKLSSFLGKVGPWLVEVDAEGNEIKEALLRFRFNNDHAIKIINSSDGGFIVIGPGVQENANSRSDGWIIKLASI